MEHPVLSDPSDLWWPAHGIFLDTSIVSDLEAHVGSIFDGEPIDGGLTDQHARQIEALALLMRVADRGNLAFAVSRGVIEQRGGRGYVLDLADHWAATRDAWGFEDRGLAPMTLVATLPPKDRLILAEAYRSGCEVVLTNDLAWMRAKHQHTLGAMGLLAYTPEKLIDRMWPSMRYGR